MGTLSSVRMTGKCTDLKSVSELSVRGTEISDDFLSVACGSGVFESFAASIFTGDRDNTVQDLCAICYGHPQRMISFATYFCKQCGLLGRFMCENCLHYHNKFTKHADVRSLKVAGAKANSFDKYTESTDIENENRELQKEVKDLRKHIKKLEKRLQ
ncbi:uncharacterized protein LOC132714424 [Ruditapes philippinarum]|uniref:uncharacterized protein LOC132714424 n=1 Tax=Ruditapes philippinarum TaxID=129788 RepID=UPI00295B875A|nr:uncharacterized protein LOC132714424 [Ruditapes philippinarum]